MNIQQEIQKALELYQTGDLHQAKEVCKRILKHQANNAEVLYFLGVIYSQMDNHDLAIQYIQQSLQLYPNNPDAYHLIGMSYQAKGQLDEAIGYYQKTIQHKNDYAEAYNNLGNALKERGRTEEAIESYRKAVLFRPDLTIAYYNLGVIFQEKRDYEEAIRNYRNALGFDPSSMNIQRMLAKALQLQGHRDHNPDSLGEAERIMRAIIKANPYDYSLYNELGSVLQDQGKLAEAVANYRKSLELNPNSAEAYFNLGDALHGLGQPEDAAGSYQRAAELKPDFSDAYNNLGIVLIEQKKLGEALVCFQQALHVDHNSVRALSNLGNVLSDYGRVAEAEQYYRRAIAIDPGLSVVNSNLLLAMHYNPVHEAGTIYREHLSFAERFARPLYPVTPAFANRKEAVGRLRIGYVSPDFRRHSVAYFIEPLLGAHNREQVEVFCYADVLKPDDVTERIRGKADHWRDIAGQSDERVADLIRENGIDILVDLAGHTANNRMLVFARKPAPVQVSWIGYPGTTGLATVNYKIVDRFTDPPGMTEGFYTEELVRMPESFLCYLPEQESSGAGPLPAERIGYVTFGSFNNFAKVSPEGMVLWAKILQMVPDARLVMKAKSLADEATKQRALDIFAREGIGPERVELLPWEPSVAGHLEIYNRVDIALDTFPYNGTTTTCEALYMGVPVITLAGRTHASRVGVSLLSNVGVPDLIAESPGEYVETAVRLAADTDRLSALRSGLGDRVTRSPLTDAIRFAGDLEKAYREMWIRWCEE